jgi:hypothetical protein
VAGGKRRRGRFLSDLAAAYGAAVLDRPYPEQVALWLNLPRVQLRRAAALALGFQAATGGHGPGRDWAEALAPTDAEAEELYLRMRVLAAEAKARRRAGG